MTTDPFWGRITEKQPKSVFFTKNAFYPQNTRNFLKGDIYLGKGYVFLRTTFSGHGQTMVGTKK